MIVRLRRVNPLNGDTPSTPNKGMYIRHPPKLGHPVITLTYLIRGDGVSPLALLPTLFGDDGVSPLVKRIRSGW